MKNTLRKFGALVLAAAVMVLPGCKQSNSGREFVNINGVAYNENEMYHNIYYAIGSSYLGILEYDETADINKIKEAIGELEKNEQHKDFVNKQKIAFVKQKVCDEKMMAIAKEQGITLTEEEQKEVENEYQSIIDFFNSPDTLTQIKEQFYKDDANADKNAKAYLEKYKKFFLGMYAVDNMEQLKDKFTNLSIINKVLENKANAVSDDEEYVKAFYQKKLESQKKSFSEDPSAFDSAYDYGDTICYYPSGLRYVKHILVKFTDEDQEKLVEFETKINELESKESRTEEEEKTLQDTKNQMNQLTAAMDSAAKARADEAYKKVMSGADFQTIINEYGEDAGMTDSASQYAKKGYLVHESSDMVPEFLTVAMALKNPGDISKPVKSTYGYHIIKYMEKGREGEVPYEEVRDAIFTIAMDEKKQEETTKYYDSLYDEMMASGQVKVNYDALGMDKETYDRLYKEMMAALIGQQ